MPAPDPLPQTETAPGHWSRRPVVGEDPRRVAQTKGRFLAIGLQLTLVVLLAFRLVPYAVVLIALVVLVGVVLTYLSGAERRAIATTDADRRLLEDFDDPDVCLVQIEIVMEHGSVGRDRGAAWFEGDRLLYSGHATSFALGGEDVLSKAEWRPTYARPGRRSTELSPDALPLRIPGRSGYVLFEPLQGVGTIDARQGLRFLKALHAFRLHPPVKSSGSRQWPPLDAWNAVE